MTKARDIADGVDTADIADGAISTAKLADNSINATKLDVAGNGTAGQVLKSDGDGSFTWIDTADPFTPTTVSGTTPSLDLGTYNFFSQGSLTGNTTLSFANVPTAKRFAYDFTSSGNLGTADIFTTNNQTKTFFHGGLSSVRGFHLKPDGTKFYISHGSSNRDFKEYTMTTAYDPTTASLTNSFSYGGGTAMYNLYIANNGTRFYHKVSGSNMTVYQYTMSTAWDLSTASFNTSASPSFAGGSGQNSNYVILSEDGTKMFMEEYNGSNYNYIREFPLSTAYNVTSYGSSTNHNVSTWGITGFSTGDYLGRFAFNSDGTKFYIQVQTGTANGFHRVSLSTAWDLSSVSSYDGKYSGTDLIATDFSPSEDTEKYWGKVDGNYVTIFDTQPYVPYTLTLPASVQNSDYATTLDSSVKDDRFLYEFVTTDGGTNVWLVGNTKYDDN